MAANWALEPLPASDRGLRGRSSDQSFALCLLARHLSGPADGLALLACPLLGWLLIGPPALHLAKNAFALELFLQDPEGLVDVVFANENYQKEPPFEIVVLGTRGPRAPALEPKLRTRRTRTV
jgi:hypothetical protein